MNNYHLFLIRSDQVTQITAHLVAGIVTLFLIATLGVSQGDRASEPRPDKVTEIKVTMPERTEMFASTE